MTDADAKAIRRATLKAVLAGLMRRARDPRRIGLRVLFLDYVLRKDEGFPEYANQLAEDLNLSPARVCQALATVEALLEEIEM